jgi:glycyl-tRNA synthetase beta chain
VLAIARVEALDAFVQSEAGSDLLALYRRAANILSKEEKKNKTAYDGKADAGLFEQEEERILFALMKEVSRDVTKSVESEDFTKAMSALSRLRTPVDTFFDKVTVNAEQKAVRENRLNLLSQIRSLIGSVADFSKIEG